jgi:D-serine deaminase-like pyridoxal phosphate-dependent protein
LSEAEALVEGGIADVLASNEVVGWRKLERLAALARRARVAVCADDAGNVDELDAAARRAAIDAALGDVQATVGLLENHGIPCPWVTGGGTGTYLLEAASGAYREVQPWGSYVFMDADYARDLGGA